MMAKWIGNMRNGSDISSISFLIWTILVIHFIQLGRADIFNNAQGATPQPSFVVELNENNWKRLLEGEWIATFYSPKCATCQKITPILERFAAAAIDLGVRVGAIDVEGSPSLRGRFTITVVPMVYHIQKGEVRQYRGSLDADDLLMYIKHKEWRNYDPIPSWKKPDTIQMTILSYFVKLSAALKYVNSLLQAEFGISTQTSQVIFAIATTVLGGVVGLLVVGAIDFFCTPKKRQRQTDKKDLIAIDDSANDDIEDEDDDDENEGYADVNEGADYQFNKAADNENEVKSDGNSENIGVAGTVNDFATPIDFRDHKSFGAGDY